MKLFNTLTRRKEEFVPLEEGKVRMYVCGPTVYNLIHIGNARPMIIFDTVRRYMEYKGYEVNFVSNFTDVDDKIIKKAIEEGVSAQEISERYISELRNSKNTENFLTKIWMICSQDSVPCRYPVKIRKKIRWISFSGNRKKRESHPGHPHGVMDVLAGILNALLWQRNISEMRLIFMQAVRT